MFLSVAFVSYARQGEPRRKPIFTLHIYQHEYQDDEDERKQQNRPDLAPACGPAQEQSRKHERGGVVEFVLKVNAWYAQVETEHSKFGFSHPTNF